ncbi:MAG: polymerase [Chthoniobacter sp.]|jgi:DNA polymerase (family 10)|nr:polymerase [Chthoniobacter sp.]
MTTPIPLALGRAETFAASIVEQLSPFCADIKIVGSIRRRCPVIGDIDIVCLPKPDGGRLLVRNRALVSSPRIMQDGPQQLLIVLDTKLGPVQVDLWFATPPDREFFVETPGNWGSLVLCRTGSQKHNVWLASQAKKKSMHWNPYKGLYDTHGGWLAGDTEESIYLKLGLDFLEPKARL